MHTLHLKPDNNARVKDWALAAPQWEQIDQLNWSEFDYRPQVHFAAGYDHDHLILNYQVQEKYLLAQYLQNQEPVYQDSCVECFLQFPDNPDYFNFEFNCIGTCLAAYGPDRKERTPQEPTAMQHIQIFTTLPREVIPLIIQSKKPATGI